MKFFALPIVVAILLVACGDKQEVAKPAATPLASSAPVAKDELTLTPAFEVPGKYKDYKEMLVTYPAVPEDEKEFMAMPNEWFDTYRADWIKQAYSNEKPDWYLVGNLLHPDLRETTNDFKKQEIADKAKTEVTPDKSSLNIIYGVTDRYYGPLSKPDIETGVYKFYVNPTDRGGAIVQKDDQKNIAYKFGYWASYASVGIPARKCVEMNCKNRIEIKVKVPLDRAKAIESQRESSKDYIRAYGTVAAVKETDIEKYVIGGKLIVDIEALEVGTIVDKRWISYFFISKDELTKLSN